MKRLGFALLAVLVGGALVGGTLFVTMTGGASDDGETAIDQEGDRLSLATGPAQHVNGETDLDPGTTVSVRLSTANASQPFLQTRNATVTENGSFAASFDLRDAPEGPANVSVWHDGSELANASATIEPCDDECEPESSGNESNQEPAETTVDHSGDALTLAAGPRQSVTGESHLDPGTELQIRIQSTDPSQPFLLSNTATVAENGSFAASVDLADVEPGANASLVVSHNGSDLTRTNVTVRSCDGTCATETPASDRQAARTTVDHDGERLTLTAGRTQEITGETHLEAETELLLSLQSTEPSEPFLLRQTANVSEDGTFATTVELPDMSAETNASLTVYQNGSELTEVDAVVQPCEDSCPTDSSENSGESDAFELDESVVTTARNETARVPVTIGDADEATFRVGDSDDGYQITATARDGNDDGRVVFLVDPSAPGNESSTVTVVGDGDDLSTHNETEADGALEPAAYDLSLYRGQSADGDADDIGTLVVRES